MSSNSSRRTFIRNASRLSAGLALTATPLASLASDIIGNEKTGSQNIGTESDVVSIKPVYQKPVQPAFDQYVGKANEIRRLRLYNPKTDEKASVVYWYKGQYVLHGLDQLDLLLRDYRANVAFRIDINVLDFLYGIYAALDTNERIQILSGYRTQSTNAMLMKNNENVARNSLHMQGKAIDFNIPGRTTIELKTAAHELRKGGVGYYPSADFIHIDSGPVREWTRKG